MSHGFGPVTTQEQIWVAILDELQQIRRLLEPSQGDAAAAPGPDPEPDPEPVDQPEPPAEPAKKPPAKKAASKRSGSRRREVRGT
jgi:hypothetical protein